MRNLTEQIINDIKEDELDAVLKPISPEKYFDIIIKPRLDKGECVQNKDGSWDCKGDVDLEDLRLTKLPVNFRRVGGDFYCSNNQLTTLQGSPKEVGGDFYCSHNKLTTLEGIGKVGGKIYAWGNPVSKKELLATIGR